MVSYPKTSKLSWGYLGYISEDEGIIKIDKNTKDEDVIFMVCEMPNRYFKNMAIEMGKPTCFDYFVPRASSKMMCGQTLYELLPSSYPIWLVSDGNDEHVYIMHIFKGMTYMLGRMHQNSSLSKLCKWRYSRIKL